MKKIVLRILAAVAAFALIGIILTMANSFVGNPITKRHASKDIQAYLDATYPTLDIQLDSTGYNFKFGEYYGSVTSPTSMDTYFTVTWRAGNVVNDSYDYSVLKRQNTLERYEEEARNQIRPLFTAIPDVTPDRVYVNFDKESYEVTPSDLVFDGPYDKTMDLAMRVLLYDVTGTPSLEHIATVLEETHALLKKNGYSFKSYCIDCNDETTFISAYDVSVEQIESGSLLSILKDAYEHPDESDYNKGASDEDSFEPRLSVYMREKNK